jgi:hypothetical protein
MGMKGRYPTPEINWFFLAFIAAMAALTIYKVKYG